jgi:phage terminase small subunit
MPALTQKQQKFVAEYLVDGNGSRAAIAAGYGRAGARVRAHRLTRDNKAVMAEIRARQGVDRQRLQIERQDVIAGLLEAVAQARELRQPDSMIRGFVERAKLLGMYPSQRVQVEVRPESADLSRFERMTDAELLNVINSAG